MGAGKDSDSYVSSLIKYLMFFFNFIFWLIGGSFIAIGAWAFMEKNKFQYSGGSSGGAAIDLYDLVFDLTVVMMVLGAVIFVIAFTGCIGALRENVCLLMFFSYVLGLLFLVEIVLAILAFVFSGELKTKVIELLQLEGMVRYREDDDLRNLIDWFQTTFRCCGIGLDGFKDWNLNPYFNCSKANRGVERCAVPYSCCIKADNIEAELINTMCGFSVQELSYPEAQMRIHTTGCVQSFVDMAEANLYILGGVALGLAIPQILGVAMSCILARDVRMEREWFESRPANNNYH